MSDAASLKKFEKSTLLKLGESNDSLVIKIGHFAWY